uniref:von Willebrand factor type A domain-containing protein n=1 Tax=Trepomonas sp. PC1 TaxID=1076344 RepID=A0A146K8R6_9EUKA|eukprot:JAP91956.1 von Willebrand factor type A domain-containing protein [Trepomonas sp. PC1]
MREDLMEVVAILDMSGSMQPLTMDTIGGFNTYLGEMKSQEMEVRMTLILFSTNSTTVYSHLPVKEVPELTTQTYRPSGGTALRDALGLAITSMKNHVAAQEEDHKPGFVSFFIQTDGEENSSREYSQEQIKEMITRAQDEDKWNFVFAGANIDAFAAGQQYGFKAQNIANIANDQEGQRKVFKAVAMQNMCFAQAPAFKSQENEEMDFQGMYDMM